jgi:hypothetical protein
MNPKRITQPYYECTTYDGHNISTQTLTREQVLAISPQSVDHFLSCALGIWGFRTADGEWIEHRGGDWPGLGDTGIRIIQAIQINPGEFLSPTLIAELTGCSTLRNGYALSARLMALREIHKESFRTSKPHFFLSRRAGGFAVCWNPQRTWCSIDRIPPTLEHRE